MINHGIKIFADGADIQEMYELYVFGKAEGFTTNPTLMKKVGVKNYKLYAKKVLELIPDKSISFEVFSDDLKTMEKEAREISSWGENVYVKIPITNTQGVSTEPVISTLSYDNIKLNITAILTFEQINRAIFSLNPDAPSIISVFAGRIADTGRDPVETLKIGIPNVRTYLPKAEVLWASTREIYNIMQARRVGCDIITVPHDILKKLPMLGKDLEELSLETVKMFYDDAQSSGFKII